MNLANLSFSALPPINVPFRYFVSAPIFLIVGAIFIFMHGQELWLSRWHPATIALTHIFTLGFISMVMMGAIYQLLPVIGGVGVNRASKIANICHTLHVLGSIALISSFIYSYVWLKHSAILLLVIGFTVYFYSISIVLIKKLSQGETIWGIRLAVFSFALVILIGILLTLSTSMIKYFDLAWLFADKSLTNIHALWGGFGWAGLLIIAVSFQVVPMFHVTPNFPLYVRRFFPATVFALLFCVFVYSADSQLGRMILFLLLSLFALFAIVLLRLFSRRKRKVVDSSIYFWQFASASSICLLVLYFMPKQLLPSIVEYKLTMVMAAIFTYCFVVSIIEGMLLKILPFLSYTHLQQYCLTNFAAMAHLPHMHNLLHKKHSKWLFYLHVIASVALLITICFPEFYWLFSLMLLLEFSWLLLLMTLCIIRYRQALKLMLASA